MLSQSKEHWIVLRHDNYALPGTEYLFMSVHDTIDEAGEASSRLSHENRVMSLSYEVCEEWRWKEYLRKLES